MMMNSNNASSGQGKTMVKEMLHQIGKTVIHNWPMKVICILMAVLLWGTLISQDASLTRTKVFENVKVNVINQTAMERNGFIVVGGLEQISNVRVTAEVPQNYYDTVTPSGYSIHVDLSAIDRTGQVSVPINHTRHVNYGAVTELSVKEVVLEVEEYVTRSRIPVKVSLEGEMPAGLYGSNSNILVDPEYVTIAGPKSKVQSVVRCVAVYDLSLLSGEAGLERTACAFVLEDAAGKAVSTENITVTLGNTKIDSIIAEQTLYKTVEMPLDTDALIKGEVAQGYRITNVTVSPESIVMAVRDENAFAGDLKYLDGAVDVSGLSESTTQVLSIIRPGDVINMNSDVAYVTVEIEKVEELEGTE